MFTRMTYEVHIKLHNDTYTYNYKKETESYNIDQNNTT